ncbi:MAG: undecaprenyl/decaprenyl-phosphate alpha-N-acetylglucosaminyl 1-phosphate transferase [Actinomycetota bacterium]|nr:undecaprenyl/decaprenyl-phosphate alpha-N-acetylglucosaminyl 1-phosphate transferase [Actinomycetota bacterium]
MREYVLILTVAAVVTYVVGVFAREVAGRIGAVAQVRDRDVHAVPIPYFGGLAMLAGLVAAYLVATNLPFLSSAPDVLFSDARAVLVGGAVICLVGVLDDVFELDALTKFVGQVAAAAIVVAQGVQLYWLPLPGVFALDPTQRLVLSVLLIVATVNAINFIDGLDGLAAGVAAIGASAFFVFAFSLAAQGGLTRALSAALLTSALAGACVGFLPHNFFPARMFMGDSGSMLIGLVLSCSAISLTGQLQVNAIDDALARAGVLFLPLILPVAMLLVPFVDLALAVVRRTRAGRSPFSPDKMHLHHRLLEIGHSHRRAVLVMYMLASLVAFGTVFIGLFTGWQSIAAVSVLALVTLTVAFVLPRWHQRPV